MVLINSHSKIHIEIMFRIQKCIAFYNNLSHPKCELAIANHLISESFIKGFGLLYAGDFDLLGVMFSHRRSDTGVPFEIISFAFVRS
jgi:hypothetical protein